MTREDIVSELKKRYDTSFGYVDDAPEVIIVYGHHLNPNAIEEEFNLTFEGTGNQCFVFSFGE